MVCTLHSTRVWVLAMCVLTTWVVCASQHCEMPWWEV